MYLPGQCVAGECGGDRLIRGVMIGAGRRGGFGGGGEGVQRADDALVAPIVLLVSDEWLPTEPGRLPLGRNRRHGRRRTAWAREGWRLGARSDGRRRRAAFRASVRGTGRISAGVAG